MRVGELARRTGVGVSTLRAWERRFGFLVPERSPAGHRLYAEQDVERVNAVVRLVAEGLTLGAAVTRIGTAGTGAVPGGEADVLLNAQILDTIADGVWVIRDMRTRYANHRMAELMRCSLDELVQIPIQDLFDPSDLGLVKQRTASVRVGGRLHFRQWLRRPDGSTFLAEVRTTPLLDASGRYDGGVAVVEDVTELAAEEARSGLRAALLDAIGEAVTASTPDGRVLYVNAAAERLFGWRAADVVGRPTDEVFLSPDDRAEGRDIEADLLRGRSYSGRRRMLRRDGTELVAHVTAMPVVVDGEVVAIVGLLADDAARTTLGRSVQRREQQAETVALYGMRALRPAVVRPAELEGFCEEAVDATRRLLRADGAALFDVPGDGGDLRLRVSAPTSPIASLPTGRRSFPGYVALSGSPVLTAGIEDDERFDISPRSRALPLVSALGAPIFGRGRIVGVLVAASSRRDAFAPSDLQFMQGMANAIGTAVLAASGSPRLRLEVVADDNDERVSRR